VPLTLTVAFVYGCVAGFTGLAEFILLFSITTSTNARPLANAWMSITASITPRPHASL
jgi:hypothetical protein